MKEFKVLMVDDEEDFVQTLAERMRMRDLTPELALSGEQALQRVQEDVPDVMVLDLKMPGIDGMEVLRRVRQAYPHVQVIMLTGHGSDKDETEARRLGAFAYLQKPVEMEKLVKVLKEAYSYKQKLENAMAAASFAEEGEFGTAQQIMDTKHDK
ncbi:MAG: response regulator [Pseudomonadota bacterium]